MKDSSAQNLSYLISGASKTGKTRLTTTTPADQTLLINVENNLASIYGSDVMTTRVSEWKDFVEVKNWLKEQGSGSKLKWVFIDSITELSNILTKLELSVNKDGRMAYGNMSQKIQDAVREFKALPMNVVFLAQEGQIKDEVTGNMFFSATCSGKQLEQSLPYMFDAVLATRSAEAEGKTHYALQCKPDAQHNNIGIRMAHNSKVELLEYEEPNLLALHSKITSQ